MLCINCIYMVSFKILSGKSFWGFNVKIYLFIYLSMIILCCVNLVSWEIFYLVDVGMFFSFGIWVKNVDESCWMVIFFFKWG